MAARMPPGPDREDAAARQPQPAIDELKRERLVDLVGFYCEVFRRSSAAVALGENVYVLLQGERTISAQTQDVGEARESLPVAFAADTLEIGFNADFLRDGVESVDGDQIVLKLISSLRPAVMTGDGDDFRYLIMPIRLAG